MPAPVDAYFVSFEDGPKRGLLLGPFTNKETCEKYAYGEYHFDVSNACYAIDTKSHFFGYGMARIKDFVPGEYTPILNRVDPEKWNKVLA